MAWPMRTATTGWTARRRATPTPAPARPVTPTTSRPWTRTTTSRRRRWRWRGHDGAASRRAGLHPGGGPARELADDRRAGRDADGVRPVRLDVEPEHGAERRSGLGAIQHRPGVPPAAQSRAAHAPEPQLH